MIIFGVAPLFPAFLGIGAQKAGTTWLHAMLSAHQEIWLPHLKELHYFDRKFPIKHLSQSAAANPGRGILARQVTARLRRMSAGKLQERFTMRRWSDLPWEYRYLFGKWDDEWYASLFSGARGQMPGEITPAYACLSETAICHVHKLMPETKLIFLMRNPIDRAWSHAKMDLARSTRRDADTVMDADYRAHFSGFASRRRGDYLETIRSWLAFFPQEQFFLGFYDDILGTPEDLLVRILKFLGVSANASALPANIRTRVNPGQHANIPPHLHRFLAELYLDDIRKLADQYGMHPKRWLNECEAIIESRRAVELN